jgi:hypothetical protein
MYHKGHQKMHPNPYVFLNKWLISSNIQLPHQMVWLHTDMVIKIQVLHTICFHSGPKSHRTS